MTLTGAALVSPLSRMDETMSDAQQAQTVDALAEIIARLERIESGVQATNGRVTSLEDSVKSLSDWRAVHQPWSEGGRQLIELQSRKIEEMSDRVTEVLLACQVTASSLERSVAKVLDQRQVTQNAAKYEALTRRFGNDPEESLNRWMGLKMGARAVGWRIAGVVITVLVTGLLMWMAALWAISSQTPGAT